MSVRAVRSVAPCRLRGRALPPYPQLSGARLSVMAAFQRLARDSDERAECCARLSARLVKLVRTKAR